MKKKKVKKKDTKTLQWKCVRQKDLNRDLPDRKTGMDGKQKDIETDICKSFDKHRYIRELGFCRFWQGNSRFFSFFLMPLK